MRNLFLTIARLELLPILFLCTAIGSGQNIAASESTRLSAELGMTMLFGHNTDESDWDWDGYPGQSRLVYPLTGIAAPELAITVRHGDKSKLNWRLLFRGSFDLTDPVNPMEDHDYLYRPSYFEGEWSSTESDVRADGYSLWVEGIKRLARWQNIGFSIFASFRYQRIEQEVIGYHGWTFVDIWNGDFTRIDIGRDDVSAIYYEVTHKSACIGPSMNLEITELISVETILAYSYTESKDYDNHLLRGKDIVGKADGGGIYASLRGQMIRDPDRYSQPVFFTARMDLHYIGLAGSEHHRFYADDPGTEDENELGLEFDLSKKLTNLQVSIHFAAGLYFWAP